jgi:two-component system response regulator GlrR
MNAVKALIIDLNLEGTVRRSLREILALSPRFSVSVQQLTFGTHVPLDYGAEPLSSISSSVADIIFLLLPPEHLSEAGRFIRFLKQKLTETPVVLVQEESDPEAILELLDMGVSDYIIPPLKAVDLYPRMWRLLNLPQEDMTEACTAVERLGLKHLIGKSSVFLAEIKKIPMLAKCNTNVMILGETGTGKELCAQAIHYLSSGASTPFIPINCGALPEELIENELFGHVRGAYTSASTTQSGLVNAAAGGTLFLDEIDCLPVHAQAKLLRFIQNKEYRSLGSTRNQEANVRVIAATNVDLERSVKEGRFRQDLYYRLNVVSLTLPPLRERREDILILAHHFLVKYAAKFNKRMTGFSHDALLKLVQYDWPGNVRELEHLVERAVVLCPNGAVKSYDLSTLNCETTRQRESFHQAKSKLIEQFEKSYIQELLIEYEGNITRAAQAARKNRRAFWQLIRKHQVDVETFRMIHR